MCREVGEGNIMGHCKVIEDMLDGVSHIKHIFEEGELEETSVVRKFRTTVAYPFVRKMHVPAGS